MTTATAVRRPGPPRKPKAGPLPPPQPPDLLDGLLTCPLSGCGWTAPDPAALPAANGCFPDALPPAAAATLTHLASHAYQVRTGGVVPLALRGPYARALEAQAARIYAAARQLRAARRAPPTLAERAEAVLMAERAGRVRVLPEGARFDEHDYGGLAADDVCGYGPIRPLHGRAARGGAARRSEARVSGGRAEDA